MYTAGESTITMELTELDRVGGVDAVVAVLLDDLSLSHYGELGRVLPLAIRLSFSQSLEHSHNAPDHKSENPALTTCWVPMARRVPKPMHAAFKSWCAPYQQPAVPVL